MLRFQLANNNRSTISPAVRLTVSPERPPSEAKDGSPPLQQPIQQQQHFGSAPPSCKSPIPTVAKVHSFIFHIHGYSMPFFLIFEVISLLT